MSQRAALGSTTYAVVQHNLGCMQAGLSNPCWELEHLAVGLKEAVEGTLAAQGRTQRGCKASDGEDRQNWLEMERKQDVRMKDLKIISTTTGVL